jgi:hypothetical protein
MVTGSVAESVEPKVRHSIKDSRSVSMPRYEYIKTKTLS